MITKKYETKEDWLADRVARITGTKLKDLIVKRGTKQKKGYYSLIADRIANQPDEENPMIRGSRLESEALDIFEKEIGKKVDGSLVMWQREDNPNIAYSPDGVIDEENCVEVKCLNMASHIEAYLTQEIPSEYQEQVIQAFVVNDKLQTLYFVFYDPRLIAKSFFFLAFKRESLEEKIAETLEYERKTLEEIEEITKKLIF